MSEPAHRLEWLALIYASALVLLVVAANRGTLVGSWLTALPASDKLGHFVLMGLLSYLANAALGCRRWHWRRFSVLKGSLLTFVLVTVEEISQLWMIHRAFDPLDLAADAAGIWFFGRLVSARRERTAH